MSFRLQRRDWRLAPEQLARVNAHFARVFEELAGAQGQRTGRPQAVTLVIAPLEDEA